MSYKVYNQNDSEVASFANLFDGLKDRYAVHQPVDKRNKREDGKTKVKCWSPQTKDKRSIPVSKQSYTAHLNGELNMIVVPSNKERKCKFSCIDSDLYGPEHNDFYERTFAAIRRYKYPLIPETSKSGAWHFWTFYNEFITATEAHNHAERLAISLGLSQYSRKMTGSDVEVFAADGHGISLPYFGADSTDRPILLDGQALTLNAFIQHCQSVQISGQSMKDFIDALPWNKCRTSIQTTIIRDDIQKSTRNETLMDIAADFKVNYPDTWEADVRDVDELLNDGQGLFDDDEKNEVESIIASVHKGNYKPRINSSRLKDWNDKELDHKKRGGGNPYKGIHSVQFYTLLTKRRTYRWDLKLKDSDTVVTLKFNDAKEFTTQLAFRTRFFEQTSVMPIQIKETKYSAWLNSATKHQEMLPVSPDEDWTEEQRVINECIHFISNTAGKSDNVTEQFDHGRAYYGQRLSRNPVPDAFYFKGKALRTHLSRINFRLRDSEIGAVIRDTFGKGENKCFEGYNEGKPIKVYCLTKEQIESLFSGNTTPLPPKPRTTKEQPEDEQDQIDKLVAQVLDMQDDEHSPFGKEPY